MLPELGKLVRGGMGGSAGLENLHAPLDRTLFGKTEDVVQISWALLKWRTVGHTPRLRLCLARWCPLANPSP